MFGQSLVPNHSITFRSETISSRMPIELCFYIFADLLYIFAELLSATFFKI